MSTIEQRRAFLIRQGKAFGDANFDADLDLVVYGGPHTIRDAIWYAMALLHGDDPAEHQKACRIIRKAIATQETDPASRWYGVLKTSWEAEAPTDPNWAEFNAASFAGIFYRFRHRLDPLTHEQMLAALGRALEAIRRRDVQVSYTNIALLASLSLILGGQILGKGELRRLGEEKLFGWMEYTNLAGAPKEYNSLTYSGVALSPLAEVGAYAEDPEVRLRAQAAEARVWLHLATHFHPTTHQLAGPHSRAYHEEITFNPSPTRSCLYVVLGDEGMIGELNTSHDILKGVVIGLRTFHCPEPVRKLFLRKTYPYLACEQTDVEPEVRFGLGDAGRLEVDHERGEFRVVKTGLLDRVGVRVTDTTCYMTASYALGTVNRQNANYQRHNLILYYATGKDARKPGGFRVVQGGFKASEDKQHPLHQQAMFASAQSRNRAIVLHTCPAVRAEEVTSLGAFLKFPEKVEALYIGERKVVRLPAEVPESAWVFLSDAGTFVAVRPLARTAFDRSSAARIERGEGALYLNMYNYTGRGRAFPAERIGSLRNGYLFEVADRRDVKTFDAFRSRVSRTTVEDRVGSNIRSVQWGNGAEGLFIEVEAGHEQTARRSFGGTPYAPPHLHSPNAVQGCSGHLTLGQAELRWTGRLPLVLIAEGKEACVLNPSTGAGDVTLRVPGATVRVGRMSAGHLIVEGGRTVRVTLTVSPTAGPVTVETDGREYEVLRKVLS